MEIIGVVKDIKYTNLRDEIPEQAFVPYLASRYIGGMTVYVRTTLDPNQFFSTRAREGARTRLRICRFTACERQSSRSAIR